MKKYKLTHNKNAIAENESICMGIDAHKSTLHFTVRGSSGVVAQKTLPHGRSHVKSFVERFPGCDITAVYESGPTGYRLKRWLEELGCDAFITPVSKVMETKGGQRIKTDRRDSENLSNLAQAQLLEKVHDLGDELYASRELTRTRQQLRENRSAIRAQIKSKLLFHGIARPKELGKGWTKAYLAWLEQGPSEQEYINMALRALVKLDHALTGQMRALKKEIEELAKTEKHKEDVTLLGSIPGVGVLTAMTFLVELGDISRFDNGEQFSSFLGLIPGEWSSGDAQKKTGCVRWGNARVRSALVESSWMLIGKDPKMKKTYERIKYRRGSGRAIVAVARRLGLIMRAMLRERKPYNYSGPTPKAAATTCEKDE